jgi:uncharacterized protein YndB with AHSA1/START domain
VAEESLAIDIAASPERVWQVVTDVESWPQWTTSMSDVKRLDPGPLRVGSRARIKQPGLPVIVWEVTDLDEGTSFSWVVRTPGVNTTAVHQVSATVDGSRLTLTVAWTGVFGGLTGALAGKRTRKNLVMEASGTKTCAESPA